MKKTSNKVLIDKLKECDEVLASLSLSKKVKGKLVDRGMIITTLMIRKELMEQLKEESYGA